MRFRSDSEKQTYDFAAEYAKGLVGGEILLLDGELGAGKTVFVKGLAAGLGISEEITSPTFTLMNDYEGRLRLYHFDVYRLRSGAEAYAAGLTDYFGEEGAVCCIEWAENITDALIGGETRIKISYLGDGKREIEVFER